jgi:hypothetical protein
VSEPLAGAAMSQDEFDQNCSAIASDVASILAAEAKSRRRFRLIAVHEKVSGHLLAEVFQTTRGPVVVTNDAEHNSRERIRRGARRDLTPFTGEPEQVFLIRGGRGPTLPPAPTSSPAHIPPANSFSSETRCA